MSPAAYLEANDQRRRDWVDAHLSVEAPKPAAPPAKPEIYRLPLFPPAPLRPWSRRLVKPRR
jgi:hypothetical protein